MNRRDFILTALGASGTVAAGGAVVLDVGPGSTDEAGTANASDVQDANGTSTATATDSASRSPTATETATDTDPESTPATSTETARVTSKDTHTGTATNTPRTTPNETPSPTGTGTPGAGQTPTQEPRNGVEVEGKSESGDDTRVAVKLTNTNDYAVYVEAAVTWQFEDGSTDSQTRSGVIAPSGSDNRHYFTTKQGTVTEWNVTLQTVQRV